MAEYVSMKTLLEEQKSRKLGEITRSQLSTTSDETDSNWYPEDYEVQND